MKAALAAEPWPGLQIIIDPDGEYAGFGPNVPKLEMLVQLAQLPGPRSLVFVPSDDQAAGVRQFAFICHLAWSLALMRRPVRLVVDELAEFTTASRAPASWRRVVKRGRKYGMSILAGSQRPAEIDKTIWSNASRIRSGMLGYADDQAVIAAALGVPRAQVAALSNLDYLERDKNSGQLVTGHLTF